jgi:hypothetical protein
MSENYSEEGSSAWAPDNSENESVDNVEPKEKKKNGGKDQKVAKKRLKKRVKKRSPTASSSSSSSLVEAEVGSTAIPAAARKESPEKKKSKSKKPKTSFAAAVGSSALPPPPQTDVFTESCRGGECLGGQLCTKHLFEAEAMQRDVFGRQEQLARHPQAPPTWVSVTAAKPVAAPTPTPAPKEPSKVKPSTAKKTQQLTVPPKKVAAKLGAAVPKAPSSKSESTSPEKGSVTTGVPESVVVLIDGVFCTVDVEPLPEGAPRPVSCKFFFLFSFFYSNCA